MRLVYLTDAGASGTRLGAFLEALMRQFDLASLLFGMSRSEMQSNYSKWGDWTPKVKSEMLSQLARVERVCRESGLSAAKGARGSIERIERDDPQILKELGVVISALRSRIVDEVENLTFLEIPLADVELFEQKELLFGQMVHDNFQSSRYDIAEAGKCMALDRSTAAVMHLMRALEPGLMAMAKDVGYSPKREDWGVVIEEIEKRLNPTNPHYVNDKDKRDFLAQAATQFRHFKDAWRNHAMHAREKYTPEEARIVFLAVKSFMMYLARRIGMRLANAG